MSKRIEVLQTHLKGTVNEGIGRDIVSMIGNTPMVKLDNVGKGLLGKVTVKLEYMNPGKSVKDRLGLALIREAETKGAIRPGHSTLVEATSGNTGIALAMLGAARGYRVILTMPETMSLERRLNLVIFGAQVVLTPSDKGIQGAKAKAEEIVADINKSTSKTGHTAYLTQQFASPANSAIHELTTGPEIHRQTNGDIDVFVMGVGTGGTTNGVASYFKTTKTKVEIVGVEPSESPALTKHKNGQNYKPEPHSIQGIGAGFVPEVLNVNNLDRVMMVNSKQALEMARRLACEEGLLCGVSAGAIVHAAIALASQPAYKDKQIVAVIPSQGERYLSTALYSELKKNSENMPVIPNSDLPSDFDIPAPTRIPIHGAYLSGLENKTLRSCIGKTPMIYLNKISRGQPARIALKMECENPGKSSSDRAALAMLSDAEHAGLLDRSVTIVEATTGNIGTSLAMICASKGYKLILFMPETESIEKRVCIRAYGAELHLTPASRGKTGASYLAMHQAQQINATPGRKALFLNQLENQSACHVHYETTGPEITEMTRGMADYVVVPIESGATLAGLGRYFKEKSNGACKVVAVQSAANPVFRDGKMIDTHEASSWIDESFINEIITVTQAEANEMTLRLPAEEGIFAGVSAGALVAGAKILARRPENGNKLIVTLVTDYGDRYLSEDVFGHLQEDCKNLPVTHIGAHDESLDPTADIVWKSLLQEAQLAARQSPELQGFFNSRILHQPNMAFAVADSLGPALSNVKGVDLTRLAAQCLQRNPVVLEEIAVDCYRYSVIDAALAASDFKYVTQFLFYKGHHATTCHRIANALWKEGNEWLALLFQSCCSAAYAVDIHPQATIGKGITVDHGTGLVIGSTAVVGRNVQFLHDITLGATGKVGGDRHPKIGDEVILGAHCQVLGNIKIGNGCVVAASAVVNKAVDPYCTVAGIPAKVVKRSPVKDMAFFDPKI
eukprot:TRINITY_DN5712_c2_g1_i1.p1 TRINITY_DN5712_c2_g1~~TRINITY_DN5712_c2_g1_i1.p1  ORF type:complete len:976 (+),score=279.80 TRINITY_DN5712_c2_g1_i1:48-2930(+)